MSLWLSFLGGLSAKAYDDLNDNYKLKHFRNDTFEEFLKGIHYISFTGVSISDPMFFYVSYIGNVLNHFANKDAFSESYEYSLLFSFPILFFMIYQSTKISRPSFLEYIFFIIFCVSMYLEPIFARVFLDRVDEFSPDEFSPDEFSPDEFSPDDFSRGKLFTRIILVLFCILYIFFDVSGTVSNIYSYMAGYLGLSAIVQYYSLYINKESPLDNEVGVMVNEEVIPISIEEDNLDEWEIMENTKKS
jgi:hypothetical protein